MQIPCPCCGLRDLREFTMIGASVLLDRPHPEAGEAVWDEFLHLRENPCGVTRELWYHRPCGTWMDVARDTATHEVLSAEPVRGTAPGLSMQEAP